MLVFKIIKLHSLLNRLLHFKSEPELNSKKKSSSSNVQKQISYKAKISAAVW